MPLCTIEYFSGSLEKATAMNVILPDPQIDPPYFTLYQLHGLSDDHTVWTRRTSIERYVAGLPLVVVMPDGGRGFYTDAREGYAFESHIIKDTLDFVERYFPVKAQRSHRAIGGLSMGGYGAVKLALKYPNVFGSAAAHSSVFLAGHSRDFTESDELARIFGSDSAGGDDDVFALAERAQRGNLPAVYFDCGRSDFLLDANRLYHEHLGRLGISHTYREYRGAHSWDYWDRHFPKALKFHRKALGF